MHKHKYQKQNFFNDLDKVIEDFINKDLPSMFKGEYLYQKRPLVNIFETKDEYRIELAVPGLTKKDFNVSVNNDVLTIEVKKEVEIKEGLIVKKKEYGYNDFKRSFHLSEKVDSNKIKGNYKSGILTLTIPKKEEAKGDAAFNVDIS